MSYADTINDIYAGIAQGDLAPMLDVLSQEAEWIEAENIPYSSGEPIVGHEGVISAVFEKLPTDFPDFHVDIVRVVEGGTTVLVEGRCAGTTSTGNKLDAIFAHVWDFDGDTVVRFQQYSDTWQWRKVLGTDD